MKKKKETIAFLIDATLKKQFNAKCARLGKKKGFIAENMIRKWLKHKEE